jgi:hypothetical protein
MRARTEEYPMATTIPELVKELAAKRAKALATADAADAAIEEFNKRHAEEIAVYAALQDAELAASIDAKQAEQTLRDLVTAHYEALPVDSDERKNKQPFVGVTVTVGETVTVNYEPGKALAYAKQHDMCLMVDTNEFNAVALAGAIKEDWLTIERKPKVGCRIDSNLDAALKAQAQS